MDHGQLPWCNTVNCNILEMYKDINTLYIVKIAYFIRLRSINSASIGNVKVLDICEIYKANKLGWLCCWRFSLTTLWIKAFDFYGSELLWRGEYMLSDVVSDDLKEIVFFERNLQRRWSTSNGPFDVSIVWCKLKTWKDCMVRWMFFSTSSLQWFSMLREPFIFNFIPCIVNVN